MKRIISLLLIFSLILTLQLQIFAISNDECTDFVSKIGIIDTKTTDVNKIVTREEFAQILTALIGVSGNSVQENFENLYTAGAIGKDENGGFRVEEPLTYNDAILGLLTIAGFGEVAKLSGGFPKGYTAIATRYGLVCEKTGIESITYDDLSALIYKMMYMPVIETVYSKTKPVYDINRDKTVMTEIFDIEEESGILTACGNVNIYSGKMLSNGLIALDGEEYKNEYAPIETMIGKHITVFFKVENGERTVLFAYESVRNKVTVINSDADLEYNKSGQFYTYTENRKTKKIQVRGAAILYNGHIPESKEDMQFVPDNGWVEFIDNNSDNRADIVKIYGYTNYYVTGFNTADDGIKIYGENRDAALILTDAEDEITNLYNEKGETLRIKQLKQGMLASVFAYKEDGILKAKDIYVSTTSVRGFLSGIDKENCEIAIDDEFYKYDKAIENEIDLLDLGTYRSFLVDYQGKLAYVNYEVSDDKNKGVGYVIKTAETDGLKSGMDVKIYDANGMMRVISAKEKLYVDGVLVTGQTAIKEALDGKSGMAAYTMYNDGRVRSIDFPEDKNFADNATKDPMNHLVKAGGGSNIRFRQKPRAWGGNMVCNENARVIILPENPSSAEDGDFAVTSVLSDVFRDDGTYTIDCYSYNNNSIGVDYIVYTRADTWMEPIAGMYVVKDVIYKKNADGEFLPSLQLAGVNGTVTYLCADESVMDSVTTFTGISSSATPGTPCERPQKGDVIKIALNLRNEITNIRMIYDYDNDSFTPVSATSYFSASHIIKGRVYDKANDVVLVTTRPDVTDMEGAVSADFEAYKLSLFKIVKVDSSNDEVVSSDVNAVKAYAKNNGEYSEVIVSLTSGNPSLLIIYE